MKTDAITTPAKQTVGFQEKKDYNQQRPPRVSEVKSNPEPAHVSDFKDNKPLDEQQENTQQASDSVTQSLQKDIQWKEMRFYRHEDNNQIYVDIIDKKSGEIIKTVPEPDFNDIIKKLNYPGITLNISG